MVDTVEDERIDGRFPERCFGSLADPHRVKQEHHTAHAEDVWRNKPDPVDLSISDNIPGTARDGVSAIIC